MADDSSAPSVQAQVSPTTAKLGDLLTLSIRVTHPMHITVEPPAFQRSLGTFEVYSSSALPPEPAGAGLTDRFQAQLQNFATGQQLLPGLEVHYQDERGQTHELKTPELQVMIQEVPPGPKDKGGEIRGLKGVIGPVGWSPWWWIVALALIGVSGVLLWRKRQRALAGPPPPPPIPADQLALQRLQELRNTDWIASGKLKEFYSALSEIIRGYLEGGFEIPALERTTAELLRDVRKRPEFTGERLVELKDLLESGDLVKFAKFRPDADEALQAHATATRFVETTKNSLWSFPAAPDGGPK
ncbi:MAG TPA: hypothetical protein VMU17_06705 [Elusimicrobiota bacterium]|nr:hypothetical protein [Elusimicrobiota bacterium]